MYPYSQGEIVGRVFVCDLPNSVGLENIYVLISNQRTPQPKANPTQEKITRVCSVRYVPRYIPSALPVPDTSASSVRHQYRYRTPVCSVRHQYRYRTLFGRFGTKWIVVPPVPVHTLIPVPETLVISVQHQYRYPTLR